MLIDITHAANPCTKRRAGKQQKEVSMVKNADLNLWHIATLDRWHLARLAGRPIGGGWVRPDWRARAMGGIEHLA